MVFAAAAKKRAQLKGAKLYVTLEPCAVCAGLIGELHLKQNCMSVGAHAFALRGSKSKWKNSIEIGLIKLARRRRAALTAIDVKKKQK